MFVCVCVCALQLPTHFSFAIFYLNLFGIKCLFFHATSHRNLFLLIKNSSNVKKKNLSHSIELAVIQFLSVSRAFLPFFRASHITQIQINAKWFIFSVSSCFRISNNKKYRKKNLLVMTEPKTDWLRKCFKQRSG